MLLGSSSGFRLPATPEDIATGQVFDDGLNGALVPTTQQLVTSPLLPNLEDPYFNPPPTTGGGIWGPTFGWPDFGIPDLGLGGFLPGGTGGFLPAPQDCGPDLVYDPATGGCKLVVGQPTMPGRVVYDNCGRCFIERTLPARTVRRKGKMVCLPGGQMACRPAARRMNALNPRALTRALRRAKAFAKFAKKAVRIQQTFKGKPRLGRTPSRKKTCG